MQIPIVCIYSYGTSVKCIHIIEYTDFSESIIVVDRTKGKNRKKNSMEWANNVCYNTYMIETILERINSFQLQVKESHVEIII